MAWPAAVLPCFISRFLYRPQLARLYRSMKAGEIAPADGTKLAYVLNLLRQAIETGQLEARLAALEAEANKVRGRY